MATPKLNESENAWEIDVPGDNSCLFWAVALAYLISVKNNNHRFQERFKKLFGKNSLKKLEDVKNWIKAYNPFLMNGAIYQEEILNELVRKQFRSQVIDYIKDNGDQFKGQIKGSFEAYLLKMRDPSSWGGEPEIRAMSDLLDCRIQVTTTQGARTSYGEEGVLILLFHVGPLPGSLKANYYRFGLDENLGNALRDLANERGRSDSEDSSPKASTATEEQASPDHQPMEVDTESKSGNPQPGSSGHKQPSPDHQSMDVDEEQLEKYSASGLKRTLHGIIYQLKLLMLFVKNGIYNDNNYDFRLATEMDAAEKFDDVVFRYKDQGKWVYRFLQAKHKQDPEHNKITINDLTTETEGDFSLQKYFVSFCKIKQNASFQSNNLNEPVDLKDFIICTNTDFNFRQNLKRKNDGELTKKAEEHNELIKKWEGFFVLEKDLKEDSILYLKGKEGKKLRFKDDDQTRAAIAEEVKSALLKRALIEIGNEIKKGGKKDSRDGDFEKVKETLEGEIKSLEAEKLISEAEKAVKEARDIKKTLRKEKVLVAVKKVFVAVKNVLKLTENKVLKAAKGDLEGALKEAEEILVEAKNKLEAAKKSTLEKANALEEAKKAFSRIKNDLIAIQEKISKSTTLEGIKKEIEKSILKGRVPEAAIKEIKKRTDLELEGVKKTLKEALEKPLSEIESEKVVLEVALDDAKFKSESEDFIKKFRFIANYPSEEKLGEVIKRELGEEFHLLNSDLVTDTFEREMLDWFKQYDKGHSEFLSANKGAGFFQSIKEKIHTLMTTGLSKAYPEKLRAYGIRFKENLEKLDSFLSFKDEFKGKQILHVATEATRLSAIKVLQTLEDSDKYKAQDSYIFMRLRTLLRKDTQDLAIGSFSSDQSHNLLVIECQSKDREEEKEKKLCRELLKKLSNEKKKVILIAVKSEDTLADKFKDSLEAKYQKNDDQNSFKSLDEDSRRRLLKKEVNFQGEDVSLNKLIDINSAGDIIDQASLSKLIEEKKIEISDTKAFSSIGYVEDYYIPRAFHRQRIKAEVLKEKIDSEFFFITGANEEDLIKLGAKRDAIHTWESGKSHQKGISLPGSGKSNQENKEIFQRLSGKNTHWLEYQNGILAWRHSKDSLSALRNYIDENDVPDRKDALKEEYFSKLEDLWQKAVIVANDPGTGKSTVLTSLAHMMKQKNPALWIARVNLNDYAEVGKVNSLENINFNEDDTNEAIKFVSKMVVSEVPERSLEKRLFEAGLEKRNADRQKPKKPKIIISFDGFDEISPIYKEKTHVLLKALRKSDIAQLQVTTRVHEKDYLEKELESLAYILNHLTGREQKKFLKKFWNWKWGLKFSEDSYNQEVREKTYEEIHEHLKGSQQVFKKLLESLSDSSGKASIQNLHEKISEIIEEYLHQQGQATQKLGSLQEAIDKLDFSGYAKVLLEKWKASIQDTEKAFTNVPLQLKMLAEVVFEEKFQLPDNFGLLNTYDKFIKCKLTIYHREKSKTVEGNLGAGTKDEVFSKILLGVHHELAVKLFFYEEKLLPGLDKLNTFKYLLGNDNVKEELARVGLMTLRGDKLEFTHRSYAEYFLSEYLVGNLQNEEVQKLLLEKILFEKNYALIRKFFNAQLGKNPLSDIELTEAVKTSITKHLEEDRHYGFCNTDTDVKYSAVLHLPVQENRIDIVKFLLSKFKRLSSSYEDLILTTDEWGRTILHLAAEYGHHKIFELLLNTVEKDSKTGKTLVLKKLHERTALHFASEKGRYEIVQLLLKFVRDNLEKETLKDLVLQTDENKRTALYLAADNGHHKIVQLLLSFVKENLEKDYSGTLGKLVLKRDENGKTVLHETARMNMSGEMVKFLLESVKNDSKILKDLILETDIRGQTVLHWAANSEVIKVLLKWMKENSYDVLNNLVLRSNDSEQTALHLAVEKGHDKIVQLLLSFVKENLEKDYPGTLGELILKCDKHGKTVLHEAARAANSEGIKVLLDWMKENSYDVLTNLVLKPNNYGQTALHLAACCGKTEVVQALLELLKDHPNILKELVLATDWEEQTALHLARYYGKTEMVQTLLNWVKANLGEEILKKLVLKTDEEELTVLDRMAEEDEGKNIKNLLGWMKENLNEDSLNTVLNKLVMKSDNNGRTPLHLAYWNNHMETVSQLLESVSDNIEIYKKLTAIKGRLDKVKYKKESLHKALEERNKNEVKNILNDVDFKEDLTLATYNEEEDDFDLFGPSINGKTILCLAIEKDSPEIVQLLLDNVKNDPYTLKVLILKTDGNRLTALQLAAKKGHNKIVEILLFSVKNDPYTLKTLILKTDGNKQTTLHLAAEKGHDKIVQLLLKFVRDNLETDYPGILKNLVLKTDYFGKTALHKVNPSRREIVNLLKEQYNTIASSLLDPNTNIADFSNEQLRILKTYVESNGYSGKNKEEILKKIKVIHVLAKSK